MSDATASGGRLGRYHLVEPIGGGANGEVHRAKVYGVAGFERQFAVKKFFPHVALSPRYGQALSAAARAYGSLDHPRIARLAEFGVSGGHTFTATELAPGLDAGRLLAETLGGGGLIPAGSALSLVSQAARAVGYAHGRGISHLGVAPANLIVSPDGEVKITDVGVLGACLPDRPAQDGRFITRVHYLAPEQLTGEPASAATDVFALGLVAYELVTGERAFTGPTPDDVAQAILTGQPREPQLPRPIMRVLQRCLARSPYERFPDARALADALDAALRVSPVPGTRGEIAELVATAMQRIALLHEQQLSGALMLNLPAGGRADTVADRPHDGDHETLPFNREPATDAPGAPPYSLATGPETTVPEMAKTPATTMQGMAPPPIPVPQGVSGPTRTSPAFLPPSATLQGVPPARLPRPATGGLPPPIPRQPQSVPPIPTGTRRSPAQSDRFATSDPTRVDRRPNTSDPDAAEPTTKRMTAGAPVARDSARRDSTGEPVPSPRDSSRRDSTGEPVPPPDHVDLLRIPTPQPGPPPSYGTFQGMSRAASAGSTEHVELPKKRTGLKVAIALLALGAGVGGSLVAWQYLGTDDEAPAAPIAAPTTNKDAAAVAAGAGSDAGATPAPSTDAATVATAELDAGAIAMTTADAAAVALPPAIDAAAVAVAPADAGTIAATVPDAAIAVVASDKLIVDSKPGGARLFLDGADQGPTPVTLPGTADRHSIALVLAGHAPYIAEIDGKGSFTLELAEVTPSAGPAGIKLKCKEKDRYAVFLDGKPTGQLCPTERLEVELGEHMVETYDLVTETRRQYPCNVKETRLSLRIKVDY